MSAATPDQERQIVLGTLTLLQNIPPGATPPEIGMRVHHLVRTLTGHPDPYQQVKQTATQTAQALLPQLRELIASAEDPLEMAIRLSIAGNIIDFGPRTHYDLWQEVQAVIQQPLAINDLSLLKAQLSRTNQLLFLGDNAGETVFDRLLIEVLDQTVTYVVRGGPILNDATRADALAAGLDEVADIIDNGAQIPGTILSLSSPSFLVRFKQAPLIISKGMGNYETLSTEPAPIFFLFMVKCPTIAQDVGAPAGSIIVKASDYWQGCDCNG